MQTRSVTASNIKERLESAAAEANDPTNCPDNAVHTTLYPFGEGGWFKKKDNTSCPRAHFRKARLASIATHFRCAEEYLWNHFQTKNKIALHGSEYKPKLVNATIAAHATKKAIEAHREEATDLLNDSNPAFAKHVTVDETFTTTVSDHVVGGKAYW